MGSKKNIDKKFRRGVVLGWSEEERVYLMNLVTKIATPETDHEKRIITRFLMKLNGTPTYYYPLYPNKECPICEIEYTHKAFKTHYAACKRKHGALQRLPKIDHAVLEMLRAEL